MGRFVPFVKDNRSPDLKKRCGQYRPVSEPLTRAQFDDQLCARVQMLRLERGWTQAQMATALGVPMETYKKYETRTPLPHYLVPLFAQHVDRDVEYVLTGRSSGAVKPKPRRVSKAA